MACSINALLTKGELKKAGYSVQNAILIFLCVFWTKAKSRSIKRAKTEEGAPGHCGTNAGNSLYKNEIWYYNGVLFFQTSAYPRENSHN